MDKYYTPEIKEFYVGFEFEENQIDSNWKSYGWENKTVDVDFNFKLASEYIGLHRVKYLSKEDIESLGWKGQESNSVYFTKDNYRLVHWITSDGRDINIFEKYDGGTQEECLIRKAKVKNKSELIKLLKQLNIG